MDVLAWSAVSVSTFLGVVVAAASGTGGGALYMPAYLLIFRDAHRAVPFAKVTIFGLSVSSFILNIRKRHPRSNRPLINFEISALLEPLTLVGAIVGVFLNLVLPSVVLMVLLVVVLSLTTAKTFATGLRQFREEQESGVEDQFELSTSTSATRHDLESRDGNHHMQLGGDEIVSLLPAGGESQGLAVDTLQSTFSRGSGDVMLTATTKNRRSTAERHGISLLDKQSGGTRRSHSGGKRQSIEGTRGFSISGSLARRPRDDSADSLAPSAIESLNAAEEDASIDWPAIVFLVVVWAINFVCLTLAGGPHAIACGDLWQQVLIGGLLSVLCGLTALYAVRLYRLRANREKLGVYEPPVERGGYAWVTVRGLALYPFVALLAGICAGSLGIGGGLIKGPLLISIGLDPLSAVTSALYMILFTSTTTTLSFALSGRLELLPSLWFFSIAAVAAVLGITLVNYVVKKFRHSSVVTLALASVIFLSMCCMAFTMVYDEYYGTHPKTLTLADACKFLHSHSLQNTFHHKHHHIHQTHVMME